MLFNEIHGRYFLIVSEVIKAAQAGTLNRKMLENIVRDNGFDESKFTIPKSIATDKKWIIVDDVWKTPIKATPSRPLRLVEKQWLKALLLDPRIKLFDIDASWLDDAEPLYTPDTIVTFDQYQDGDPFEDAHYISVFRTLLTAIKAHQKVRITFESKSGTEQQLYGSPKNLEYSPKDNKFRLRLMAVSKSGKKPVEEAIRLVKIIRCNVTDEESDPNQTVGFNKQELVFVITDERNATERVLLHFSHFEKKVEKLDETQYRVTLQYQAEDANEVVNRLLSFGPMIKVISPPSVVDRMRAKIFKQLEYTP